MINALSPMLRAFNGIRRLRSLSSDQRAITVYAERAHDWSYLGPIVNELIDHHGRQITYVTSDLDDPRLNNPRPEIEAVYVGTGAARTAFFLGMQARVALMTMPDLQSFHLKRSRAASVHYMYLFHALVSTHMIYRPGAFDHYDTILCAGPHHLREIRAREQLRDLPAKNLVECGYPRLDTLCAEISKQTASPAHPRRVLLAPSWGPEGTLETIGHRVIDVLLDAGLDLTVRPHPMTVARNINVIKQLRARYDQCDRLHIDDDIGSTAALEAADVLVSDWSGVALEYAFARKRPVVFLDVPRKVNNPGYSDLPVAPVEVSLREQVGSIVSIDDLGQLPTECENCIRNAERFASRIAKAQFNLVFNAGESARIAAEQVVAVADREHDDHVRHAPCRATTASSRDDIVIDTRSLIDKIANSRKRFDADAMKQMSALCKRLSIDHDLFTSYGKNWNRLPEAVSLSLDDWNVLLDLLLDENRLEQQHRPTARWKFVNAALTALDVLGERTDTARWAEHRNCASAALQELAAGSSA